MHPMNPPSRPWPRALSWLALLPLVGVLACAAPCEKVQSSHLAFRKATVPAGARASASGRPARATTGSDGRPHLSVSLPYELVDTMVAQELGRVPVVQVPLPAVAGVSLGKLRLGVEAVRAQAAPAGELGFRVVVGLRQGTKRVLSVDVDARVKPRIDPNSGSVDIRLAGRDIVALEPSISSKSRKQLGDWIWSQLPGAAKLVVDRGSVTELAGNLASQLMGEASSQLERKLLDSLGEFVHLELDLPDELPLARIDLRAGERNLDIELRTRLQVVEGLGPAPSGANARVEGIHPNLVQVRISGDATAALVNHAIREGRIPGRWTLEGEPDPAGELHVGVGWAEGKANALELHLWKLEGDCAHVVLRGEPHLAIQGGQLELGTQKAKVDAVVGSAKVRAGLFFSRTARRGVELVERTTAATELELGDRPMQAQVAAATVSGDEVVLGLRLNPRRSKR